MHRHKRRQTGRSSRVDHHTERATIELLGSFAVTVDGVATPEHGWTRRSAASLVKVLALAPGQRMHHEQMMDILWPHESTSGAAPRLHKAAHYARRAAGRHDAVVLRNDIVHLFPTADLSIDVVEFEDLSRWAIADGDAAAAKEAIERYAGDLLPDDRYEEWAGERRELLRFRHLDLLRIAGDRLTLSELDPDEASSPLIPDFVAELVALTRRQAALLESLAAAVTATDCLESGAP